MRSVEFRKRRWVVQRLLHCGRSMGLARHGSEGMRPTWVHLRAEEGTPETEPREEGEVWAWAVNWCGAGLGRVLSIAPPVIPAHHASNLAAVVVRAAAAGPTATPATSAASAAPRPAPARPAVALSRAVHADVDAPPRGAQGEAPRRLVQRHQRLLVQPATQGCEWLPRRADAGYMLMPGSRPHVTRGA